MREYNKIILLVNFIMEYLYHDQWLLANYSAFD